MTTLRLFHGFLHVALTSLHGAVQLSQDFTLVGAKTLRVGRVDGHVNCIINIAAISIGLHIGIAIP